MTEAGRASYGAARPEERRAAFRQAFAYLPAADRDLRAATGEGLIHSGEMDPAGLLVARRDGVIVGAIVCVLLPGAAAMIWPPQAQATDSDPATIEDALVRLGTEWVRQHGVKLGQMLLAPSERSLAEPLLRNGFRRITQLRYLRHCLTPAPEPSPPGGPLTFAPYSTAAEQFRQTVTRTYEDSKDVPEINGIRTIDEILASHGAQGRFDPNRWWLVQHVDRPVGVLLLNDLGDEGWDVTYTGVVAEARRRGFGRRILRHALAEAALGRARQLTLAVDERNIPAWNLYEEAGFVSYDHRDVYLSLWPARGRPESQSQGGFFV